MSKVFSVELLINWSYDCHCTSSKRLAQFIDHDIIDDNSNDPRAHVCTMDTKIIHHHGLREAITLGLNHIPLRTTNIQEAIQVVIKIFIHICQVFGVEGCINVDTASKLVRTMTREKLILAMKENLYGFRYSKPHIFSDKIVNNERAWLEKHMFIHGLDKAISNVCFVCIFYIRN